MTGCPPGHTDRRYAAEFLAHAPEQDAVHHGDQSPRARAGETTHILCFFVANTGMGEKNIFFLNTHLQNCSHRSISMKIKVV